jgi:CheY-like chemotaxis protein
LSLFFKAPSGAEAIKRAASMQSDLILMDLCMLEITGVEATGRFLRLGYDCNSKQYHYK